MARTQHQQDGWLNTPTVGWLMPELVARNLPALLAERHLSQAELVRRSGLCRRTVHKACRGGRVSLETLVALAEALGVSIDVLCPGAARTLDGGI